MSGVAEKSLRERRGMKIASVGNNEREAAEEEEEEELEESE